MRPLESLKRIITLLFAGIGLGYQIALFGDLWYREYADVILIDFWRRGHWAIIALYGLFLFMFSKLYGGMRVGFYKTGEVIFSQIFAIICVNIIEYVQICLMSLDFVVLTPLIWVTFLQSVGIAIWLLLTSYFYGKLFAPRDMLLIYGERPIEDIVHKFETRKDKYNICRSINISEGMDAVCEEAMNRYDAVILWDIPTEQRNKLLKFCFGQSIRVYTMPKISDVIIKGSDQLHLFDSPILLTREYVLTLDQRMIKRVIDLICSFLLLVIASPVMLVTAIAIKLYDRGPVLYKQVRCTGNQREFRILKFRSMRVDAEKDGVARLATKGDNRITPIGRFIRKVRIDELPQLLNILRGDMSFIGPRPERPEIIKQYLETMPEFIYRTKVKAGLGGYAQVYGKYNTTPYDKLKLDLFYIENYSVWLDLKLMLLTLKIILKPESTEGVDSSQITAMKQTHKDGDEQ